MAQQNRGGWFIARVGFELVAVTFSFAAVGYYLDTILKMKIFPALSLLGLVIGGVTGFWLVYREMSRLIDDDSDKS
ncbi:MAG: AtpZ/AtpI family protein [Nitrospiraceae bacterium]|nr:AtpZ/AtpI family protein [Nitrospiraceae bacterium]